MSGHVVRKVGDALKQCVPAFLTRGWFSNGPRNRRPRGRKDRG